MKTAKEIIKANSDYPDSVSMDSLVGKKICVFKAETMEGLFGTSYVMHFYFDGKKMKKLQTITKSEAIVKILKDKKNFPFAGTIVSKPSKKRKGKFYYAFE